MILKFPQSASLAEIVKNYVSNFANIMFSDGEELSLEKLVSL